ncbi:Uncharacterised protein [Mycobacterium tuberculosis]|nr:Uncharacterised protein [Mycobacterium tuberculosis]
MLNRRGRRLGNRWLQPRRDRGLRRRHLDGVAVGSTQHRGRDSHRDETDGSHSPSAPQRLLGSTVLRLTDQDHHHRDTEHRTELASGANDRRRGGIAAALGDLGQRCTAQHRQRRADTDALQQLARQPHAEEIRLGPDTLQIPHQAAGPDQRTNEDDDAMPMPTGNPTQRRRHHGSHHRSGRDRETRLQQRVVPHIVEVKHMGKAIAVKTRCGDQREQVPRHERPATQQRRLDQRRGVRPRAVHEPNRGQDAGQERTDGGHAQPTPVRPLDQTEGNQPERYRKQQRTAQVRHAAPARGAALDEHALGGDRRDDAQRNIDQ